MQVGADDVAAKVQPAIVKAVVNPVLAITAREDIGVVTHAALQ